MLNYRRQRERESGDFNLFLIAFPHILNIILIWEITDINNALISYKIINIINCLIFGIKSYKIQSINMSNTVCNFRENIPEQVVVWFVR